MPTTIWQALTNLTSEGEVNAEMVKKYRNTILKIKSGPDTIYANYRGQSKDGYHLFSDLFDQTIKIAQNTDMDVSIWFPRKGLYNIAGEPNRFVFFRRTATRQYRKGINEDTCKIYDPVLKSISGNHSLYSIHTLLEIAKKREVVRHLDEACILVQDPNNITVGVAINYRWGVSASTTDDASICILWLYDKAVATIKNGKIVFINPTFIQELLDEEDKSWYTGYGIL